MALHHHQPRTDMSTQIKSIPPIALLLPAALVLLALAWFDPFAWRAQPRAQPVDGESSAAAGAALVSESEPAAVPGTGLVPIPARDTLPPAPTLWDDELRALLEKMAVIPWDELDGLLRPMLVPVANMERVLALLASGALGDELTAQSAAEIGAVKALALAALVYNTPGDTGELSQLSAGVDGRAFLVSVLEGLAIIPAPSDAQLARLLTSLRAGEGALLSVEFLPLLRELAAANPEKSDLFESLLADLAAQLSDEERAAYYARFLSEIDSPKLLKDALIGLFGDEAQAATAMSWATELFDSQADNRELRREIAMAIAVAAPAEEAAAFFGQRATSNMYAQLMTLGMRPEAADALLAEYDYLATLDSNPGPRKMLVAGMASLGKDHMFDVARYDPAPQVRGQAVITMTAYVAGSATPEALELIRTGFRESQDPGLGIPAHQALSAAHNLAQKTRNTAGSVRDGSVDLMREIALDHRVPTSTRERAVQLLSSFLSHEDFDVLKQQVSSLPFTPY
ncbi:MAG: hypothetical protein CMJ87_11080 [Planctomycetes bacterium]|nr:hypothetical protein [Planctomycetota bacterium]